jgi:BASS family bile acid:Na+ symporter
MPFAAFTISLIFGLPSELAIGMILVGSASGGTASNVICYLAKADVALSISLTLVSTLLAVLAMLALTWLYAGAIVPVPVVGMLVSVTKIVLFPVLVGLLINQYLPRFVEPVKPALPLMTTTAIVFVIAIIVALNAEKLASISVILIFSVALHNALGLMAGYYGGRLMRQPKKVCRTLAIEVGMQNSGLAVALAMQYFSALSALPGALFSVWHNVTGSILAARWKSHQSS